MLDHLPPSLTNRNLLLLLSALAVGGCSGGNGAAPGTTPTGPGLSDDDDATGDDDGFAFQLPEKGPADPTVEDEDLLGLVRGPQGQPLEGVRVVLSPTQQVLTDHNGRFGFTTVEPGHYLVNFQADGFADTQQPIEVQDGEHVALNQILVPVDFSATFHSVDGLQFVIEDGGPTVDLPAGSYIDKSGEPYEGTVLVDATWYDLDVLDEDGFPAANPEIMAVPGDFTAVDNEGEDQILESFGMFQVNLQTPDGEELNLSTGAAAHVEMPVQGDGLQTGDTVPAWSYDEQSGKWTEEGVGNVVDVDGTLMWVFDAPHFSSWNCDAPVSQHGCLSGQVIYGDGQPYQGARVRAVGIGYQAVTDGRTGADGSFCVEVKNGEQAYVVIDWSDGQHTVSQQTQVATIPAASGSCNLGAATCVDLGEIRTEFMTCISGQVVNNQGGAQPNAQIVSPQGASAISDSQGRFTLDYRVFERVDLYVLPEPDHTGFRPTSLYTLPGSASNGSCPNRVRLEAYTNTGCSTGRVLGNSGGQGGTGIPGIPVTAFDPNWPENAIFSTTTGTDGVFCMELPADQSSILTVAGGTGICDAPTVNPSASQAICGPQGCTDVGDITCNF